MKIDDKQKTEIVFRDRTGGEEESVDGFTVERTVIPHLLVGEYDDEEQEEKIELPAVRLIKDPESTDDISKPYGPDRARVWKKTGEWLRQLVVEAHPVIQDMTYENRLKAEESYFHGKEDPDYYEWQEDEETLAKIRGSYREVKEKLADRIGRPARSDFDELYPHKYDDPGLSERARRAVRDLKAIFGSDIVVSLN